MRRYAEVLFVSAIYWPIYEELKDTFVPGYDPRRGTRVKTDDDVNITARFAGCAAVACSVSATLTHPIAVVQSMVQTSGGKLPGGGSAEGTVKDATKKATSGNGGHVRSIIKAMWAAGGWRAFTRGATARILYMVCTSFMLPCELSLMTTPSRFRATSPR